MSKLTQRAKSQMLKMFPKEQTAFRFMQCLSYLIKTDKDTDSFIDFPDKEFTLIALGELISEACKSIEDGTSRADSEEYNLETEMGQVLLIREGILLRASRLISIRIGGFDELNHSRDLIARELKDIKVYSDKSFLRNVLFNMRSKNNLMKFITCTFFLSKAVEEEFVYNLDYDMILDEMPDLIALMYSTHRVKEHGDVSFLINLETGGFNFDMLLEDEITENNIRDFIENMVEESRYANDSSINRNVGDLVLVGRKKGGI